MKQQTRITFVSGSWPPIRCGVGDYLYSLVSHLRHLKAEVVTSVDAKKAEGVNPVVTDWQFSSWPVIKKAITGTNPDIIHFQYHTVPYGRKFFPNYLPRLLYSAYKVPKLATIHEFHDASRLGQMRVEYTLKPFKHVLVSNVEDQQALQKKFPNKLVHLVRVGSNIPVTSIGLFERKKLQKELNPEGKKLVVYFGYIDPSKGVEQLVESTLHWPQDTRLVLATEHDPSNTFHAKLHQKIVSTCMDIHWTGFLSSERISALLHMCDVVCLPFDQPVSMRRGSLIAALEHHKPIITTGPASEVLVHKKNSWLLTNNNPSEIQQAVTTLLSDVKLATLLRSQTKQIAKQFEWGQIVEQHEEIYRRILTKS